MTEDRQQMSVQKKRSKHLEDERIRSSIEGKFGQGKRRFSLGLVMAKLPNTSRTAIAITFLVMNLSTGLKRFLCVFLCLFAKTTLVSGLVIIKNYNSTYESQTKNLFDRRLESIIISCPVVQP
jgi:hypothetical protein